MRLLGLSLVASSVACAPLYVRQSRRCRDYVACSSDLEQYRQSDERAAREAFRSIVEHMERQCAERRASFTANGGRDTSASPGAWGACVRVAALRLGTASHAGSISRWLRFERIVIPSNWEAGLSTVQFVCRAYLSQRHAPPHTEQELDRVGPTACGMWEDIERASALDTAARRRAPRYDDAECARLYEGQTEARERCANARLTEEEMNWFDENVRIQGANAMVNRLDSDPPPDRRLRNEAIEHIAAFLGGDGLGGDLLNSVRQRHRDPREVADGALTDLETRIAAGDPTVSMRWAWERVDEYIRAVPESERGPFQERFDRARLDLRLRLATAAIAVIEAMPPLERFNRDLEDRLSEARQRIQAVPEAQRAEFRARFVRLVASLAERFIQAAEARSAYAPAIAAIDALRVYGDANALDERKASVQTRAAEYHARLAAQHLAARRFGAARLHSELARRFGRTVRDALDITEREVLSVSAPLFSIRAMNQCAWVPPLPETPSIPGPRVDVELRFTRCESTEQRWRTTDPYTFEVEEVAVVPETESYTESQNICGPRLQQVCGVGGSGCRTVTAQTCESLPVTRQRTVSRRVSRRVQRSSVRQTEHRSLHTALEAECVISLDGITVRVPLNANRQDLAEEQYRTNHGSREFSAATEASEREAAASALLATVQPGGQLQTEFAYAMANRLLAEAARLRDSSPAAAENAYALAAAIDIPQTQPAVEFLARRYGIWDIEVRAALALRR